MLSRYLVREGFAVTEAEDGSAALEAVEEVSPSVVLLDLMLPRMSGLDAIRGKNEWWFANNEVHNAKVNGPFVGEDQFAVEYAFETTFRPTGQRSQMSELALYTVKDGKIVTEQFFYNAPDA